MSYKFLRILLVLAGVAALAQFAWSFADFVLHDEEYQRRLNVATLHQQFTRAGDSSEEGHLRVYDDYKLVSELNVTAKPKATDGAGTAPPPPPKPRVGPDDLRVVYIQYQPDDGRPSYAYLVATKAAPPVEGSVLVPGHFVTEGERFEIASKPGVQLEVAAIRETEVDLQLIEGAEDGFTLRTHEVEVVTDTIAAAGGAAEAGTTAPPAPAQTRTRDGREYEVGTEDLAAMREMPEDEILAAVQVAQENDPVSGRVRGLRLKTIRPGSLFARQGLQQDDVILSVNGYPATDRKELMDWLGTQEGVTTFAVRIERKGLERTLSYRLPR